MWVVAANEARSIGSAWPAAKEANDIDRIGFAYSERGRFTVERRPGR